MKLNRLNRRGYTLIFIGCIAEIVLYFILGVNQHKYYDSPSYFEAFGTLITGKFDFFRTPIYPLFLGICKYLVGLEGCEILVPFIQWSVFMLSVMFFGKICDRLLYKNTSTPFYITAIYAWYPTINSLNNAILTESFGLSLTVFFIYAVVRTYDTHNIRYVIISAVLALIAIFLRPIFVYFIPFLVLYYIALAFMSNFRKVAIAGFVSVATVAMCVMGYMLVIKNTYGLFSISCVTTYNNFFVVSDTGLMPGDDFKNEEFIKDYNRLLARDSIAGNNAQIAEVLFSKELYLIDKYGIDELARFENSVIRNHPIPCLKKSLAHFYKASYYIVGITPFIPILEFFWAITPKIFSVYILCAIFMIILIRQFVKTGRLPFHYTILWIFCIATIVTAILGAQDEWGRLIIPAIPSLLLMTGCLLSIYTKTRSITEVLDQTS